MKFARLKGMASKAVQVHDDMKSGILHIDDRFNMKNIKAARILNDDRWYRR